MQVHDDHDAIQPSPDDLPVIDIRRLWVLRSAPPNGPLRRRPAHSEKNRSLSGGWGSVATTNREPPQPALTSTPNSSTGRPRPLAWGSAVDRPILCIIAS
jgi:hypothetical protein